MTHSAGRAALAASAFGFWFALGPPILPFALAIDVIPSATSLGATAAPLVRDVQIAGDALVYLKRAPDDATFKLYLRESANGAQRLLFDPARYSQAGSAAAIEYFSLAPNGKRLAVGVADGGTEGATLHIIDVATRQEIGAPIPRARGAKPTWRFDSDILFYTQQLPRTPGEPVADERPGSRVYMRTLAPSGATSDVAILGSGLDPAITIGADDTLSVHVSPVSPFAIGVVSHGAQSGVSLYVAPLIHLRGAATTWRKFASAEQEITAFDLRGEWIYMLTREDAPGYQVVRWSLRDPGTYSLANAEIVVPDSQRVLRGLSVAKDALYVHETDAGGDALRRLEYNVKLKRVATPAARGKARANARNSPAALPKTAGIARGTLLKLPHGGVIEELVTDPLRTGALVRVAGGTQTPAYYSVDGKTGVLTRTELLPRAGAD